MEKNGVCTVLDYTLQLLTVRNTHNSKERESCQSGFFLGSHTYVKYFYCERKEQEDAHSIHVYNKATRKVKDGRSF